MIAIAIATLLSTAHTVEHRGQRYDVAHRAQVETRTRTVGAATGSKPSMQRCRWTATVQVERTIVRDGGPAAASLLPGARTLRGDRHGACIGAVEHRDARVDAAAAEMVAAAQADRTTTLAAIDAAHALTAN